MKAQRLIGARFCCCAVRRRDTRVVDDYTGLRPRGARRATKESVACCERELRELRSFAEKRSAKKAARDVYFQLPTP